MQIEITRTARRFHLPPDVAQALIEAGLATEVPKEHLAPAKPEPRWIARNHPLSGKPELIFAALNQEQRYPGPNCYNPTAAQAQAAFTASGHPVPENVLAQFSALLERPNGNNPDVANEARLRAQSEQYSREQSERSAQRVVEVVG
jgi:hypothetical protein